MFKAVALSFIAVFILVMTAYLLLSNIRESTAAQLKRRLRRMARETKFATMPDDLRTELLKDTPSMEQLISRVPLLRNLDKLIDQCGLNMRPAILLVYMALSFICSFIVAYLFKGSLLFAAFVGLGVFATACIYVLNLRKRRSDLFAEQLPEALTMISRSLRAGHALSSAIELVGNETRDPLGGLFKTAYEQQKMGLRMTEALNGLLQRMDSLDLRFFITVIAINSETGGNLSEILDKLAETIRERLKLSRQVQVYTAQGRLSGYILTLLPIVAFFALQYIFLPGYETVFLTEKNGQLILAYAIISQFIGYMLIKRIINIRI